VDQDEVYSSISGNITAAIQGINSAVLAFGPVESGKTYSIFGTSSSPGIVPHASREIFAQLERVNH
jgi:hypothetical protein